MEEYNWQQIDGSFKCGEKFDNSMLALMIILSIIGVLSAIAFIAMIVISSVLNERGNDINGFIIWLIISFCVGLIFSVIGLTNLVAQCKMKRNFYKSVMRGDLIKTKVQVKPLGPPVRAWLADVKIDGRWQRLTCGKCLYPYKFSKLNYVVALYSPSVNDIFFLI